MAEVAHLEAAMAGKMRQAADAEVRQRSRSHGVSASVACSLAGPRKLVVSCEHWSRSHHHTHTHTETRPPCAPRCPQAQQHQQQRSLSRLKEQLHWCVKETEALKRQLSDKEAQLQRLRAGPAAGPGAGASGGASVARQLGSLGGFGARGSGAGAASRRGLDHF